MPLSLAAILQYVYCARSLHGFDLPDKSCVNKEVDSLNNKLTKIVKPFKLVTLLKFEQKREHFTRYGMHLNATGKASAAKLIVNWVN